MNIIDSPVNSKIIATYTISIGKIYIFDCYVVAEYNEGLHLSFDDYEDVINIIDMHFANRKFGYIANRVNSYSFLLTDAHKYHKALPNLHVYAVVYYSTLARQNVDLENRFFQFNRESFSELSSAIEWVKMAMSKIKETQC
ncbi:hypothetical protein SAMN03097699_1175 [Flavobacteriaceae bacterium MAR_2010_188]|nr:hypothetical protein SAMN03097699_1175 [Flavobacteriaceae bacterium MAR_2010_188]